MALVLLAYNGDNFRINGNREKSAKDIHFGGWRFGLQRSNRIFFVPSSFEKIIADNNVSVVSAKSPFLNFIILYFFN